MLPVISGPNRVVITATKSAFERNESQFARFFVDALAKDVADVDKDGRVSLLEAFRYATVETKRVYENATKLQTEHAQFDDMGLKTGVADPGTTINYSHWLTNTGNGTDEFVITAVTENGWPTTPPAGPETTASLPRNASARTRPPAEVMKNSGAPATASATRRT